MTGEWRFIRIHFYEPSAKSAATQFIEGSAVYYIDARGVVANGDDDSTFRDFDFANLDNMAKTDFIVEHGVRYIYTWDVLDASGMRYMLFYEDPLGSGYIAGVATLAVEVVSLCLIAMLVALAIGRGMLSPIRKMEQDNRAYRAALEEKDELLSQDGLLRMLYGEKPRRDAPAEKEASSGDPFVVLIVAGAPNELEKHRDGIDSTVRSLLFGRGVYPLLAHYNGQVLVLAQSPHLNLDAMEEAAWELAHALASECETQSIRIYVSPVHASRSEVHPAYLEALEAMRFEVLSAQSRPETSDESENGGVVLYGSLEMRTAHESIRKHLDETEENASRAAGELDLLKAAEYCEELAVYEGGGDPSTFSTYRLVALKSRLSVAVCESTARGLLPETLQDIAKGILACEGLAEIVTALQDWALKIEQLKATCSAERSRFQDMLGTVRSDYKNAQFSATRLADRHSIAPSTITKLFKKYEGCTFLDYLHGLRIGEVKRLLLETNRTLEEIAQEVGYGSVMTMIRAFRRYEQTTPGRYRELHRSKSNGNE